MAIEKAAALDAQGEDVVPILLEALKDPTAGELGGTRIAVATSTRETAVLALLNLKTKGTKALTETGLKTLEGGLKDAKPNVREHTVNAIGMVGPDAKSSAPAVIQLCTDKDPQVRSAAYSTLERIKSVPAEPILKLLVHVDVSIAEDAASALEWLKPTGSAVIPLLLDALKREARDKDDSVAVSHIRSAAAEALAGVGKGAETAVPALVDAILKARPEDIERMTRPVKATDTAANMSGPVMALRRIGAPAVAGVIPLLKSEQAIVRYQAAAVFSGVGPAGSTALPDVQTALESERGLPTGQMYVFEELVAAALNLGGDPEMITAPVIALLGEAEEGVRFRATFLIARIGRKANAAVPKLIELLNDPVSQVQVAATEAIAAVGPGAKSAVGPLAKKVEGDDKDLARAAARALRVFGPAAAAAVPALTKALSSNDQNFCIEAAQALTAIGPDAASAAPALAKVLVEPQSRRSEKEAAALAIAAIGPGAKDALPAVTRLLSERDTALRVLGAGTLGKIAGGSPDAIKKLTDALKDPLLAVHFAALKALVELGPAATSAASDVKVYLSKSNDPAAKVWAATALVSFDTDAETHLKSILSAIKDKAPESTGARVAAIEAVAVLGAKAKAAGGELKDALKDKSLVARGDRTQIRERAARSIARMGGETARGAIPALTDMLRDTNPSVRRAAAEALGTIGPDAIVAAPKLRELTRTDPALADAAQDALDRIEPAPKME